MLWKCTSKDQVRKIIFFFHTSRSKNFFLDFSGWKTNKHFSILFQTP